MDAAMGLLEWVMALIGHGWDVVIQRGHAQDWPHITANILHIVLAYALAFPIGWERGKNYNIAGLRTFPIFAMATSSNAQAAQAEIGRLISGFDEYTTGSGERKTVPYGAASNWWSNNQGQTAGTHSKQHGTGAGILAHEPGATGSVTTLNSTV
jgi:hypothetical protein